MVVFPLFLGCLTIFFSYGSDKAQNWWSGVAHVCNEVVAHAILLVPGQSTLFLSSWSCTVTLHWNQAFCLQSWTSAVSAIYKTLEVLGNYSTEGGAYLPHICFGTGQHSSEQAEKCGERMMGWAPKSFYRVTLKVKWLLAPQGHISSASLLLSGISMISGEQSSTSFLSREEFSTAISRLHDQLMGSHWFRMPRRQTWALSFPSFHFKGTWYLRG